MLTNREIQQMRIQRAQANRWGLVISLAVLATFIGVILWFGANKTAEAEALATDPVTRGAQVFQSHCAGCHGRTADGQPGTPGVPALNRNGMAMRFTDGEMQRLILERGLSMPAYQGALSSDDVSAVIQYLHTLWTPEQLAEQQERSLTDPLR